MTPADVGAISAMAREISEIPSLAERLIARPEAVGAIAERIREAAPRLVILCGRGSSGHVGVYLRYLFEARLGVIAAAAAPSVVTAYRQRFDMRDVLFVVTSQSGRSPDLVEATRGAATFGALTLAIVNDDRSPVATACDLVLPIGAGIERSVAATKTVTQSMVAGALLISALARDRILSAAVRAMPDRLSRALVYDWSEWGQSLSTAPASFVAARGYGLGAAREIALKVIETLRLPALAYSAAELLHGPRAAIGPATPVLILRQNDNAAMGVDRLIEDLSVAKCRIFTAGGPCGTLPWIGDDHPVCDPVVMLIPAYRTIEAAARRQGLDPDNPPHLNKLTFTL